MYAGFKNPRVVNIGAIGFVSLSKIVITSAIDNSQKPRNKSDRKRNRKDRWR